MSRIGRLPVTLTDGVTAEVKGSEVVVKGKLGTLTQKIEVAGITVAVEGSVLHVTRANENKETKAAHGLYRALIHNMVEGVSKGYTKELVVNGVGYKVAKQGNKIVLNVGYSHPVEFAEPEGITLDAPSATEITVKGIDKAAVGQCAANIRGIREPEPYHAYGIRYKDEVIVKKVGKKNAK